MRPTLATRELELSLARQLVELRRARGWAQIELGRRVGISRSAVARVESGASPVRLTTYVALFEALGARPSFVVQPPFVEGPRRQADRMHALCSAYVRRRRESNGWLTAQEVGIGSDRSVGWIDVLSCHPGTRMIHVDEIKTRLDDIGRAQRSLDWYEREAWAAARRQGWRPRQVVGNLLVLATDENEALLEANRELFRQWLPIRASLLAVRIASCPSDWPAHERGLALIDPRNRRSAWLRPTRLDGRRTRNPYLDYRDAASR